MTQPPYPPQQPPYWPQNQQYPGHGQPQQAPPQQAPPQQLPNPQVLGPGGQPWPQQPWQPGAPAPDPSGMPPQQPAMMPQQAPQPQGPPQAPPAFQVNDEAIKQAYAQSQSQGGGFDGPLAVYYKWLGPNGETNWKTVHVGFQRVSEVWVCQPPQGQHEISFSLKRHHIMWYEAGQQKHDNIDCWDPATCGICLSAPLAAQNPNLAKSVKAAEARWQHYYQILDLQNLMIHYVDNKGNMRGDNMMRPLILACSKTMHDAIGAGVNALGMVTKLVDPYAGRPMLISRKKTGNEMRDVEYNAQYAPDAQPLPQEFYGALQNLWDLKTFRKKPTQEDWTQACVRLGWPVAGAPVQSQVPANFQQGSMPPHQNPYQPQMPPQTPQMPPQQMPQMPPQQMPQTPQTPQTPQMPPQQMPPQQMPPQQMPPQQRPPQQMPPQQMPQTPQTPPLAPQQPGLAGTSDLPLPSVGPPPGLPQGPPPPAMGAPVGPPQGPPPPMSPPPIATGQAPVGAPDAAPYAPIGQPSPAPTAVPTATESPLGSGGAQVPFSQASVPSPVQQLTLDPQTGKILAGMTLPDGQERCFGKHHADDNMCKGCVDWIKSQCVVASGVVASAVPDAGLAQLQQQLEGGAS